MIFKRGKGGQTKRAAQHVQSKQTLYS